MAYASELRPNPLPAPAAILELLKPVTWFAPMWAYMCGAVSSGVALQDRIGELLLGMALAGPLVCATSQAVNDWYDRHVDAINEPNRPIPSGRIPGRWGLYIAISWTGLSLLVAAALGQVVLAAACVGLALAWAYSAPPLRLKRSGWAGPAAVGFSYEGISWFTGAAVMAGGMPGFPVLALVALYSAGAFGIMTLNDFKAIEGDRATGVASLPVVYGPKTAGLLACVAIAAPQVVVATLLLTWAKPWHAGVVVLGLIAQLVLMRRLMTDPARHAPWYNATGVTVFVLGMLTSALAVSSMTGAAP